jgi:hypothetical protein
MKMLKLLILIGWVFIIIACNKTSKTILGVYVTDTKNEFTILSDTLVITAYNIDAGTYRVEKRSGYHRIRDGKILPKEFGKEAWTATFDKDKQVLQETSFGRQVYLNTGAGTLSFGATYRKIK